MPAQEDERTSSPEPSRNETLFIDKDGFRIAFFLHKSIKKGSRPALVKDIESHGGCVINTEEGADTVLVPKDFAKEQLQLAYDGHRNAKLNRIFVEPSTFIRRCIRDNKFYHSRQVKGMGGIPAGRSRVEFTEDDDRKICEYLAKILPDKEMGGRLGQKVYKGLFECAKHKPVEYGWVKRHTVESWRERYKKFAPTFDQRISKLAKANPGIKPAWPEDRRMTHEKLRRAIELDSDGEEVEEEQAPGSDDEEEYVPASPPKRRRSDRDLRSAKRARVSSPPRRPSRRQRPSATSKGKEKAVEEEEEEEEEGLDAEDQYEGTSLFSRGDLEEDLFGDFPSPEHTFADNRQVSPEYPTQDTLVATSSQDGPSKVAFTSRNQPRDQDFFPQPTSQRTVPPISPRPISNPQPQQHSRSTVYVDLPVLPVHRMRRSQPQPPSPRQATPEQPQPTPPTPPPAQPSNVYRRPLKAARRPLEFVEPATQESSGPYRNTRARSRTVEPPPVMPKKQQKRKKELEQTDVILGELMEEDIPVEESITPIGETLAEERDVENLLNAGNHGANIVTSFAAASRARSMESDDAQVARNLREGSIATSRAAPTKGIISRLINPDEFLKQIGTSTSHSRFLQIPFGRIPPVLPQNEVLRHRPQPAEPIGLRRETPRIFKTPERPYTPQQRVTKSPGSATSSVESFPLSGTRASAYKNRLRQLEKHSPYKPPVGTRAAALAMGNPK